MFLKLSIFFLKQSPPFIFFLPPPLDQTWLNVAGGTMRRIKGLVTNPPSSPEQKPEKQGNPTFDDQLQSMGGLRMVQHNIPLNPTVSQQIDLMEQRQLEMGARMLQNGMTGTANYAVLAVQ